MSKKKNTLKDLDEFLKQQAASLVTPEKLNVKTEPVQEKTETPKSEPPLQIEATQPSIIAPAVESHETQDPTFKDVFRQLQQLSRKLEAGEFRKNLFELILATIEAQHHQRPEDKILINTMLYLKHGQHWKEGIKEYWQNHE